MYDTSHAALEQYIDLVLCPDHVESVFDPGVDSNDVRNRPAVAHG